MKKLLLFCLIICGMQQLINAQKISHVQGDLLLQIRESSLPDLIRDWAYFKGDRTGFLVKKRVSEPMDIWLCYFDFTIIHETDFLKSIRRDPRVRAAQFNHLIDMRSTIPNDPEFSNQWQYVNLGQSGGTQGVDLDAELAWDITTGGLTVEGDTIVVAILDAGLDLTHQDFEDNLWKNYAEIPNNGLDDDGNGYVDDHEGWSISTEDDNIGGGNHGTAVTGIIGAKGNNSYGVSGVNWNVKLMIVKNNFNTNEADVIAAYAYPLIQRQRYNESNGTEGAFVVATNSSWGSNNGTPEDAPLWCAMYDSLGTHGILNCGATANESINVDLDGDLPTTCPSDFLVSVTNVDHNGLLAEDAGYGAESIDLGAPGNGVWTTIFGNSFGPFGGTSAATPHVSAAVALLYAAPCYSFMSVAKSDPAAAALLVRQHLLEGVVHRESLEGKTVTEGGLNLNNSLLALMNACVPCAPPSSLFAINLTETSADLTWNQNDSIITVDLRWRLVGTVDWTAIEDVQSPYNLSGLTSCSSYEYQLRAHCINDDLEYTSSFVFTTDGCCEAPAGITISNITSGGATVFWPAVVAAESYNLEVRRAGVTTWTSVNTSTNFYLLSGLDNCTDYEARVQSVCGGLMTDFSAIIPFTTDGCGVCQELNYCEPEFDASQEWIDSIAIGDFFTNSTGSDNGYGDYTGLPSIQLEAGSSYHVSLVPGYADFSFSEDFVVWIDLDQDGGFANDELLFDPAASQGLVSGQILIPEDTPAGNVRMRVMMQFQNAGSPCFAGEAFGEIEDYCVKILDPNFCNTPVSLTAESIMDASAILNWQDISTATSYVLRYRKEIDLGWSEVTVSSSDYLLENLEACATYEAQVSTLCMEDQSDYSATLTFETLCSNAVKGQEKVSNFMVFPNPFRNQLTIELDLLQPTNQLTIQLLDPLGRLVKAQNFRDPGPGLQYFRIENMDTPPGLYLVEVLTDGVLAAARKVLKQ